MVQLRAVDESR